MICYSLRSDLATLHINDLLENLRFPTGSSEKDDRLNMFQDFS